MSGKKKIKLKGASGITSRSQPAAVLPQKRSAGSIVAAVIGFVLALCMLVGVGLSLRAQGPKREAALAPLAQERQAKEQELVQLRADFEEKIAASKAATEKAKDEYGAKKDEIADRGRDVREAQLQEAQEDIKEQNIAALMADLKHASKVAGLDTTDPKKLNPVLNELKAEQAQLQTEIQALTNKADQMAEAERERRQRELARLQTQQPQASDLIIDTRKPKDPVVEEKVTINPKYVEIEFLDKEKKNRYSTYSSYSSRTITGYWVVRSTDFRNDWKGLSIKIVLVGERVQTRGKFRVLNRFEVRGIDVEKNARAKEDVPATTYTTWNEEGYNGSSNYAFMGWVMAVYDSDGNLLKTASGSSKLESIAEKIIDYASYTRFDSEGKIENE